mgnify:CR=1 FL=1
MSVKAWGNLNKGCLSFKSGSDPVEHLTGSEVTLTDCELRVQPAGHKRIVARGQREVVARIHGASATVRPVNEEEAWQCERSSAWARVSYNPKARPGQDYFGMVDHNHDRVTTARQVRVITHPSFPDKTRTRAYVWVGTTS